MFAEALDGLLQKENMAPATDSTGAVEGGDRDRIPPCSRIGWVEVVRRVSAIAVSSSVPRAHRTILEAESALCSSPQTKKQQIKEVFV